MKSSAKRTRIEPKLIQCTNCKKKFFSFLDRAICPECIENGQVETIVIHKTSAVGPSEVNPSLMVREKMMVNEISRNRINSLTIRRNDH